MTHDELRTAMRTAVSRYARTVGDGGGVPFTLVEELTRIADQHAIEENAAAVDRVLAARVDAAPFTLAEPVVARAKVEPAGEPFNPPSRKTRRTTEPVKETA